METQLNNKARIIPEIIYVKYENEEFQNKLNDHEIIIQIKADGEDTDSQNEYHDEPDLFNVDEDKDEAGLRNNNEILIGEYYTENVNYEKEITTAVNSIESNEESEIKYVPALVEINQDLDTEDCPVLMFACKNADDEEIKKFICKQCGLIVGCIYCLKSHYESVHLKLGIIQYQCSQILSISINQADICPKCKLICSNKEDVIEHRKKHFVSCNVCGMSFESPLYLSNHCKVKHDNSEVFLNCDLCEDTFKELIGLSDHYQVYHGMIICIVCLKRFACKTDLEQHHRTHTIVLTAESPLPFACSKCDKAFNTISELSKHLTTSHAKRRKGAYDIENRSIDKKANVKK